MRRGEIWWASLPRPTGSGPGGRRPVLILQSDLFNQSRIRTVVIAIVTSNAALANAPGNVYLPKQSSGLQEDSTINVSQILTVDKLLLTDRVATLSSELIALAEDGIRLVLNL
jgi:mRNA interferase MazF